MSGDANAALASRVAAVLFDSVSELNEQLPQAARLRPSLETVLTGTGGSLDSLGLINFIVLAEEKLEDAFGRRISLIDGDVAGERAEVFSTLRTLTDYVIGLLENSA